MGYSRVLARPYFMTLYFIFPIHVNFPLRLSNCICMLYLIIFTVLPQSAPIFHVSLSIIYQLFFTISCDVRYTWFFVNIPKGFFYKQFSFNILNIWKNLLFFLFMAYLILWNKNEASANFKAHMLCLSSNFLLREIPVKRRSVSIWKKLPFFN